MLILENAEPAPYFSSDSIESSTVLSKRLGSQRLKTVIMHIIMNNENEK